MKFIKTQKSKHENILNVPKKTGDKFTTDRFNTMEHSKEIFTVKGFKIPGRPHIFSKLSRLLKINKDISLKENMDYSLEDTNFELDEIMVLIEETNGQVSIRECVKINKLNF
jgi:hypothetical protein